jgi:Cell wall binding domain 2 (CWB2)
VIAVAAGIGAYLGTRDGGSEETMSSAPAPPIVVEEQPPSAPEDLGFPAFATRNTTRVSGADPTADAAAVALAAFPAAGGVERPAAVSLVAGDQWAAGVAAASLTAAPVGAPILLTDGGEVPQLTTDALESLDPQGSKLTDDRQAFVIGSAATPRGLRVTKAGGANPAAIADEVDRLRGRLTGAEPAHVVIAGSDPEYAMPAAAWAARSGDPVLFVGGDSVPGPTADALRRHEDAAVYVLGPEAAVSAKAFDEIVKLAPDATRVGAEGPVENAIGFARYSDAGFGWNINDPGHGFVIASTSRPIDAAAAAPLSAGGTWGPLLLTDDARSAPTSLRNYLLDLKPGYTTDPTRAVYNHVWLIGDPTAISVQFQADVDQLAEVAKVRSGSGSSVLGPAPGTPEHEQRQGSKRQ